VKIQNRFVTAVFVTTLLLFAESALAQRFFGRTNSLPSLAANEAVQKDLNVSREAAAKLSGLSDEYRAASQREMSRLGIDYTAISDLPALERAAEMRLINEKTAQVTRKLTAEFLPKLEGVLTAEQMQRLKQIQLQASGIEVWIEPHVAKELKLSDEQQKKLTDLRNEYSRRQQLLDGDFQQRFARIRELNAERDAKALAILTAEQKTKLEALQGAAFDVSQLGFGRRRGNN
jgi:hypothetical protein